MTKEQQDRISYLKAQIETRRNQISLYEKEIEQIESLSVPLNKDVIKLAEVLHDKRCKCYHTDECWYYNSWEDPPGACSSRMIYYNQAAKILKNYKLSNALDALEILG